MNGKGQEYWLAKMVVEAGVNREIIRKRIYDIKNAGKETSNKHESFI